jgi:hypothetical protein
VHLSPTNPPTGFDYSLDVPEAQKSTGLARLTGTGSLRLANARGWKHLCQNCRVSTDDLPPRPSFSDALSSREFARWYWTKDELSGFCRSRGLSTSGGKVDLAGRLAAFLDGRAQPVASARRAPGKQLTEPLAAHTIVPQGQRCSQVLRAWFSDELGSGFHFDAPMREFFAGADGTSTLADALDHWANTRNVERTEIAPQFELNRFTRAWHQTNPAGTREQMLAAWKRHRSLPVDRRDA